LSELIMASPRPYLIPLYCGFDKRAGRSAQSQPEKVLSILIQPQ
jgi:hypothetical protein